MKDELLRRLEALLQEWAEAASDRTYEDCETLMEQREEIFRALAEAEGSWPMSDPGLLERITAYEAVIRQRFAEIKDEAAAEMGKLSGAQRARKAYDSSYDPGEGLFYELRR